jgi:hypothetical protein
VRPPPADTDATADTDVFTIAHSDAKARAFSDV